MSIKDADSTASVIEHDVALIHRLANGQSGKLVLASYGENPQTGERISPKVEHFLIGDVAGMTRAAKQWSAEANRNVYIGMSVLSNSVSKGKKGTEAEIQAVNGIVADFDAKDDPHAHEWSKRLPLKPTMVLETSSLPTPSFQCRYLFETPVEPKFAKALAARLQQYSGCDTCTKDVSHVWRLSGTNNYPTKNKVFNHKRPLEPQLVKVLVPYEHDRLVAPEDLAKYLGMGRENRSHNRARPKTKTRKSARSLKKVTLDKLDRYGIGEDTTEIIRLGRDEQNPKKGDSSRSGWLFKLVCDLKRAKVPSEIVYSIIMDPDYKISESVLEKGRGADAYAKRQIKNAKVEISDPLLESMNKEHAVIENFGSKTVVITFDKDTFFHRTFEDFRRSYQNRLVTNLRARRGNGKPQTHADYFLNHPHRRQYKTVEFLPGMEAPEGVLNMFSGFLILPKNGTFELFDDFVLNVICAGNSTHAAWLLNYLSHLFQRPGETPEVCVVLRGRQGVGKNFFVERVGELVGPSYFRMVTNPKHLVGSFNFHLWQSLMVLADEAFYSGDKKHAAILKNLVTQSTIAIEPKGVDVFLARKYFRLFMNSNETFVVPAEVDDRRYFVLDVSPAHAKDHAYFASIMKEWTSGGREAFYDMLTKRDISKFNHRHRPETRGLDELKIHSLLGASKFIHDFLQSGGSELLKGTGDGKFFIATDSLRQEAERQRLYLTQSALAAEVQLFSLNGKSTRMIVNDQQRRGYVIPELAECRARWATARGLRIVWPEDDGVWISSGPNIHRTVL
ncbi:MAG: primase-helicase family protein [Aestuariivirga sp.]